LLVARNKTRDALSAAYKLTHTEDGPTGKISNDVDKEPTPGTPNIELRDGYRIIVQEDEEVQ
jgi:nicotinic acid phosphoribosyltransferase